ncbi:NlpC/P60 family protein [Lewinella sp. IMCC34183]|uniref:C40 family peptidase n=1 Tax=Lewinella sp. IMCC34183 TaxID=2248762 RepID=UPI000E27F373|nr:NlpC/P60 family protein [Lewinella sp. IMCC34183]
MEVTYATGKYTAAPLLAKPRPRAPLVSQLLFGEPVRILAVTPPYCRVEMADDGTEGYILADQLAPVDTATFRAQVERPAFALELFCPVFTDTYGLPVTFGARLPHYDGLQLRHGTQRFRYSGQALLTAQQVPEPDLLLRLARKWLYVPEFRGGRTPTGVGAGELIQLVARLANLRLPREPAAMCQQGRGVDFVLQCQEADLAFFQDDRGRIVHVGLILSGGQVLHVCGRVRIDPLDHFGIFDRERGRYSHRLRIVRRLLPDAPPEAAVELGPKRTNAEEESQQILIF